MNLVQHFNIVNTKEKIQDIELTEEIKRMVMNSCNVRSILESWNVRPVLINNKQWKGYCPDHYLHDGHAQHLPKWFMSAENGDCICFTSSKASNFVYLAKRMYRLNSIEETIKVLTNGEKLILPPPDFILNQEIEDNYIKNEEEKEKERLKGIMMVKKLLNNPHICDECIEYFSNDGIVKDTLDFLGICSIEHGYLEGRAIIPFIDEKRELTGYVAVNYMGKEWWVKKQYDKLKKIDSETTLESVEKSYRKTLYCPGFSSRNHLYGLYEVLNGGENVTDLVIVEGERDAIKLLQEGIDCVSVHGTFLKDEQKTMLKKINPSHLYLGFDMDKAGNEATIKSYNALINEVEDLYVLNFPENKDPKYFNSNELINLINYTKANRIRERIMNG
jgi:hypothetical protein